MNAYHMNGIAAKILMMKENIVKRDMTKEKIVGLATGKNEGIETFPVG